MGTIDVLIRNEEEKNLEKYFGHPAEEFYNLQNRSKRTTTLLIIQNFRKLLKN